MSPAAGRTAAGSSSTCVRRPAAIPGEADRCPCCKRIRRYSIPIDQRRRYFFGAYSAAFLFPSLYGCLAMISLLMAWYDASSMMLRDTRCALLP